MSLMATALVLAWAAIVLLTLAVAGLMRQVHLLLTERTDGAPAARAPAARALPADLVGPGGDGLVLFASTSCVACSDVMPALVAYRAGGRRSCTVVTAGARHPGWPDELAYREHAADLFEQFEVVATPHALKVAGGSVVDAAPVGSVDALQRLIGAVPPDRADVRL
jgi:hypothetical protein